MPLKKNNNYKPLYKQFLKLKENIQSRKKVFNFKKQKWKFFIHNCKKKLKRYNKFKPHSQIRYTAYKFPSKRNSYHNRYLNTLHAIRLFKLFYGGLGQKSFKKILNLVIKNKKNYKKILKINLIFLNCFETRLDTVLYRSKFSSSMRNSRQLISHGKIFVNNKKIKSRSFILSKGDIVTVDFDFHFLIKKNIQELNTWPVPSKHLTINYKTLQIIIGNLKNTNTNYLNVNLNIEKIINY